MSARTTALSPICCLTSSRRGGGVSRIQTVERTWVLSACQKQECESSDVHEKFSVARANQTRLVNVGGHFDNVGNMRATLRMFEPPNWVERPEPLKVKEHSPAPSQDLDEPDSYVDIGDVVVQVLDEEQA